MLPEAGRPGDGGYRPSKQAEYEHIDALVGEPGKNVIDWDLIESQFRHLMRVAVSVREGAISSSTLLKPLRSGSKKNATYIAFREVGRVIRTVQLLRYLSDAPLRRRVTAATNKVESFNRFSQWIGFGNRGVIADNDPVEQEKAMKFNALLTNAVIFHNALDIAEITRQLLEEGWTIEPEDLAHISPYLTEHINRFGEYSTHELGIQPEAYDPKLRRAGSGRCEGVEPGGEVGVGGGQVRAGGGQGGDEVGGIVVGEGRVELADRAAGVGGKVRECGDLAGEAAQVGRVAAGPSGGAAVGGPGLTGGLDTLLAGGPGRAGTAAQVAAFGGLAAGDAEGVGEVGPAGARVAGRFDQAGLPSGELLAYLPQQRQGGQGLFRTGGGGVWGLVLGFAQGGVYGVKGRCGGKERHRAVGVGAGQRRLVSRDHGHLPRVVIRLTTSCLSSIG
ncbi:Tn3 family transposase [Actinomadura alba]|uniref:Tn3 family transposase n=1 Tax=Actinomadura alba TaxID=406431 RepID=A0ABR7LRQ1_9ACTN|nr:Tn3 family transposase [Actinomadura alba]MBC6467430.1 Tn3 family transposase [Actinomadura alba]